MAQQLKIFVSHSHQDDAFCRELVTALRGAGADVWYDEHNMGSGQLGPTIERELKARAVFVLILSPAAVASAWVEDETRWAYGLYRKDRTRTIQPVLAGPLSEDDIWLFLQDFKRIEAPGVQPYPLSEAIFRTLHALGLGAAGAVAPVSGESATQLVTRGKALNGQTKHADALPLFQRAVQIEPSWSDAWDNLAFTLQALGRLEEARTAVEKAISLDPTNALAWARKGQVLATLGRGEEALTAAEESVALDPSDGFAWVRKGQVLALLNRDQEALTAIEKGISLDPSDALTWSIKGFLLVRLERLDEALTAIEKAISLDPTNALFWAGQAGILAALERFEEALTAAEKGASLDPDNAYVWAAKADTLRGLGRIKEAEVAESRAKGLGK